MAAALKQTFGFFWVGSVSYTHLAERKYRDNLVNAYDNSIRYTDDFLSRLIRMLEKQQVDAAMPVSYTHLQIIAMICICQEIT